MPTYEYLCQCGHEFEEFQSITAAPVAVCPECGQGATRLVSAGAGLIFKGSGFYITDYKNKHSSGEGDSASGNGKSDSAKSEPASADSSKGDSPKIDSPKADSAKTDSAKPKEAAVSAASKEPKAGASAVS